MATIQDRLAEAEKLTKSLLKTYQPEKIILFGSVSRQEEEEDSDIDLLIIKDSKKKRAYRIKEVFEALRGVERKYALDAVVYTPEEVKKRMELGDHFVKAALSEGEVLYG